MSHKSAASQLERGIELQSLWTNPELLSGFPQTAHFLAADPDKSTVIFRRFDKVSIRNLLNLEGRVAALEAFQEDLDREDFLYNQDEEDIPEVAQSWEDFALIGTNFGLRENSMKIPLQVYQKWSNKREKLKKKLKEKRDDELRQSRQPTSPDVIPSGSKNPDTAQATTDTNTNSSEELIQLRWDVTLAIKDAVKEYQEAVLLYSHLLSLEAPAKRSIVTVSDWFKGIVKDRKKNEEQFRPPQFLQGTAMYNNFGGGTEKDRKIILNELISLHPPADDDPVSKKIANSSWIYRLSKDKDMSDKEIDYVPEKTIHKWVTFIGLVAAIAFLIAAIWVIWVIPQRLFVVKLGVLTAFVILFGIWVNYATTATRSEVFAATAAYAAVLVVYVGKG